MNNDMTVFTPEQAQMLPQMIQTMMSPIVETMTKLLEHNAEALEQLAGAQKVQNDRLEALEKQIRLNTLVTPQQVKYFNDAIRARARELLNKKEIEDAAAIKKLGTQIRKSVLARYGIGALHEIPKHEYSVVMSQIAMWNDVLIIRDIVREVRKREEEHCEACQPAAGLDGGTATSGTVDQLR